MIVIVLLVLSLLGLYFLDKWFNVSFDQNEPPVISQPFPFFGHLWGMIRHGNLYYSRVSKRTNFPIYSLRVPRSKIYVVKSPHLAALVDRHAKHISFGPYAVEFVRRFLEPSKHAMHELSQNMKEDGMWGLRPETIKTMHEAMSPGEGLTATTRSLTKHLYSHLDTVESMSASGQMKLFGWLRHMMTQATTDAVYGAEQNPFHELEVESGFWDIKEEFVWMGLNKYPHILAPKAYRGRQRLFKAFKQYYANKGYETASQLVRNRWNMNQKYEISEQDIAHFDMSICFALMVNSVPTAFWSIVYLYSRPQLLQKLREELMRFAQPSSAEREHTIDISDVVGNCPELESFVNETLRVLSFNASGRIVLEDTMIDGYLLKKDSVVFTPSGDLHADRSIWGESASSFDAERFIPGVGSGAKAPASSFRAFGGGASLCPGRFLFMNEITIILTIVVLKYDILPLVREWREVQSRAHITASVLTPTEDIDVEVKQRLGWEDVKFNFLWRGETIGEEIVEGVKSFSQPRADSVMGDDE